MLHCLTSNRFVGALLGILLEFLDDYGCGILIFRVITVLFDFSKIAEKIVVKYQPNKASAEKNNVNLYQQTESSYLIG